eukprot:CAMPEP_0172203058 /NCGR_PEP_ID=MMETSP1050-20130122/31043_1 /TAXON_ID=233186 /ORGANISM="Cryptomonas curvata, Strain CCAP979/52" /LENGTH=255 /DNA_ID=CAMNT_0012881171 /DNA_START=185 /DNA_END=950 /DNA_ORIENTATION=-
MSAANGHLEAMQIILSQKGVDKNPRTLQGNTPLHLAALNNREPAIKLLVNNGVDLDCKNNMGLTPADVAPEHAGSIRKLLADAAVQRQRDETVEVDEADGPGVPIFGMISYRNLGIPVLSWSEVTEKWCILMLHGVIWRASRWSRCRHLPAAARYAVLASKGVCSLPWAGGSAGLPPAPPAPASGTASPRPGAGGPTRRESEESCAVRSRCRGPARLPEPCGPGVARPTAGGARGWMYWEPGTGHAECIEINVLE